MICRGRLLVDDAHPWDDVTGDRGSAVADAFEPLGFRALDDAELTRLLLPVLEPLITSGDLVVLPLMSGGLLLQGVQHLAAERGARVIPLHTSKHPFVTLSADGRDDHSATLRAYEAGAVSMEPRLVDALRDAARAGAGVRVVFVDSNTARGRDALLIRRWMQARSEEPIDFRFVVAVNETTHHVDRAPGWRAGPKDLVPDAWAIRLVGSTTVYLSHLRFLALSEANQFERARAVRAQHPELTRFWDTLPPEFAAIHGHRESNLSIHTERTHARLSREDAVRVDAIAAALASLDERAPAQATADSRARRFRMLSTGAS